MIKIKIKTKKKGFTLMELIIVISIIGILASIIYPGFVSYTEKAKLTKAIQDAKTIVSAVDTYNSEQDVTAINEGTILSSTDLSNAIIGSSKLIKKLPSEFSLDLTISDIRTISDSKVSELNYDKSTGKVTVK